MNAIVVQPSDPMERLIAHALRDAGVEAVHDSAPESPAHLDFFLPGCGVHIEVKQFHSDRIAAQMARADDVVAVQGAGAVRWLAELIRRAAVFEALAGDALPWHLLPVRLTASEVRLAEALMRAAPALLSREALHQALYGPDQVRTPKIVDVLLCKLRPKLVAAAGVQVSNRPRQGYWITTEDRDRLLAAVRRRQRALGGAIRP